MSFYCVSIMRDCFRQFTLLDVHSFHPKPILLLLKLIIHNLLETHTFQTKQRDQAIVVATVAYNMIAVQTLVVYVKFMEELITWCSHLQL